MEVWVTAQCWCFPIREQMLWGHICRSSFRGHPTAQLSAVWRDTVSVGGISTALVFNHWDTYSGVSMISNSQPVCFRHTRICHRYIPLRKLSPGCWELREIFEMPEKGTVKGYRDKDSELLNDSQGKMEEYEERSSEGAHQCHSLGESGHCCSHWMDKIAARWQFSNTWIWPIPSQCPWDQQRLCVCHMEELSSASQLVKSYLSFMCVSLEVIALHF